MWGRIKRALSSKVAKKIAVAVLTVVIEGLVKTKLPKR